MDTITAFLNTTWGRWLAKAAVVMFGSLISSGQIPLDTPVVLGFSLGQILIGMGILLPTGQMNPEWQNRVK